jgi:hypothetical protein
MDLELDYIAVTKSEVIALRELWLKKMERTF